MNPSLTYQKVDVQKLSTCPKIDDVREELERLCEEAQMLGYRVGVLSRSDATEARRITDEFAQHVDKAVDLLAQRAFESYSPSLQRIEASEALLRERIGAFRVPTWETGRQDWRATSGIALVAAAGVGAMLWSGVTLPWVGWLCLGCLAGAGVLWAGQALSSRFVPDASSPATRLERRAELRHQAVLREWRRLRELAQIDEAERQDCLRQWANAWKEAIDSRMSCSQSVGGFNATSDSNLNGDLS